MNLELRAQSVELKNMLPNEWWGSCHVVTEGADCNAIGDKGILNSSLLTLNSSLLFNAGGMK